MIEFKETTFCLEGSTKSGASVDWFFEQEEDYKLIAQKTYKSGNKPYTLTQIRRNLDSNGKIINY
jgi:uncharacterized OB-fold protein